MRRDSSWQKARIDLYLNLKAQCEALSGRLDDEIVSYQKDYFREFRRTWKASSVNELLVAIKQVRLVLMGDFHALNQSQKGHVRILRLLPRRKKKILFVEFLKSQDQPILDDYLNEVISEGEFLQRVNWQQAWGFSWKSYKPILTWAKRNKVPVIAIDKALRFHGDQSLAQRDTFAAQLIARTLDKQPDALGIVIIGDYHISKNHLPLLLRNEMGKIPIVRIFQNSENIYLKLLQMGKEYEVDVIRFNRYDFCLVSVAPWVKWHSLLMHYEETIEGDQEISDKVSEEVYRFYRMLKDDWHTPYLDDDFHVTTITDNKFLQRLDDELSVAERRGIKELVEAGGAFYFPQLKTILMAKLSLNHVAEAASTLWHFKLTQTNIFTFDSAESFYSLVWMFAIQYLGSKLINPKRKMATLFDLKREMQELKQNTEVTKWVIRIKQEEELWLSGMKKRLSVYRQIPDKKRVRVARELGFMFAEKLYFVYRKKWVSRSALLVAAQSPLAQWKEQYFHFLREIDQRPDPYFSKYQKV